MDYLLPQLLGAFDGRLVGSRPVRHIVAETILLLPQDIIEHLIDHCWFLCSSDDAWAYTFDGNDIKGQHLIFLSDELFQQSKEQIQYTILHEIGHVMLNHRNSIGVAQTRTEINKQEQQADQFARTYLEDVSPSAYRRLIDKEER